MHTDWQTLLTLLIGLAALLYLLRRWWPAARGLFGGVITSSPSGDCEGGASPSCGSGCGACGSSSRPARDHRVHIVRRRSS